MNFIVTNYFLFNLWKRMKTKNTFHLIVNPGHSETSQIYLIDSTDHGQSN